MAISERTVDDFIAKYVQPKQIVAVGTSVLGESFLKRLALTIQKNKMKIEVVPTSLHYAAILRSYGIPLASMSEIEVDLAIEFVDQIDKNYNYIKRNTTSLVRDKMIAQSAAVMIAVCNKEDFVEKLHGKVAFEICMFGWKRTLIELDQYGKAELRRIDGKPYKTETGHYLVDVDIDEVHSIDDLDYHTHKIPGVLETGFFIGMADRIVLVGENKIEVKSRLTNK